MPTEPGAGWWAMYAEPSGVSNPPQYSRRWPVDFFVVNGSRVAWVIPPGGGDAVPADQIGVTNWSFEEVLGNSEFMPCTDQVHTDLSVGPPILDPDGWDRVCGGLRA